MVLSAPLVEVLSDALIAAGGVTGIVTAGKRLVGGWRAKSHLAREVSKEDLRAAFGAAIQTTVRHAAERLKPVDRQYVEEALGQVSERGRQAYAEDAVLSAREGVKTAQAG